MKFRDVALAYLLIFARDWYIVTRSEPGGEKNSKYFKMRENQITDALRFLEENDGGK